MTTSQAPDGVPTLHIPRASSLPDGDGPDSAPATVPPVADIVAMLDSDPSLRVKLQGAGVMNPAAHSSEALAQHIINNPPLHHLVNGTTSTDPGEGRWDFTAPDVIQPDAEPLPLPPVPPGIESVVSAVTEVSRCSPATALAAVLGSINLAVAEAFDVQTLSRRPKPTSLYFVVSSRSGWRKSEGLDNAFEAHDTADNLAEKAWKVAKRAADASPEAPRAADASPEAPRAADRSPVAVRDNATIAALLRTLAWGRRTQGLKLNEAATMFSGHSFTNSRVDSMAELVKLWDGSPSSVIRVRDDNMEFRPIGPAFDHEPSWTARGCRPRCFQRRRGQRFRTPAAVQRRCGEARADDIRLA